MTLKTGFLKTRESILDLIFPPRCIGCGCEGQFICMSCMATFAALEPPFCQCCGVPVAAPEILCPRCRYMEMAIDGIRSPLLHQGMVREAIHQLKYNNLKVLARPLGHILADYLSANDLPCDIIISVPSHRRRLRSRGYNQAALLAHELSMVSGLPLLRGELIRLKNTSSQVTLGVSDRMSNVEGVFRCKTGTLEGRRVLLIDDVCTTGATLNACAVAVKAVGARSVWGLTVSRECLEISQS